MILTTNISKPLIELLNEGKAPIDALEVGPWYSIQEIIEFRKKYPNIPLYFHGGDIINGVGVIPGQTKRIHRYIQASNSPWLSLHITFLLPGIRRLFVKRRWYIPKLNLIDSLKAYINAIKKLNHDLGIPILEENPDPIEKYSNIEINIEIIQRILQGTNSFLLLDIGHARLSAQRMGISPEEYISQLPMSKVYQVHVSGPREKNGILIDVHEPLQEIDFKLLEFVLGLSNPKVLTLEYIRNSYELQEQLLHLRAISKQ
jgi:uncharacterized protein (UPF0276 family)